MKQEICKVIIIITSMNMPIFIASSQEQLNTAGRMMLEDKQLTVGGYAQIDYNAPIENGVSRNSELDVHRMVLMFGYKFTNRTQFISEVEIEHAKEVFVEQAFLQYEILPWLKFRGGLILIPMGIINEFHEPPTFNGVERPNLDKFIVPTTWREIGAGFTGLFQSPAFSYQLYILNGFKSYDDDGFLSGSDGFRKGRQKGAESLMNSPNIAFKVNYFGISGLQVGLSYYAGKTQSSLFNGLDKSDEIGIATADSSVVGLSMIGGDARYLTGGLQLRAQINYGLVTNSSAYNEFTGRDLGSAIAGWYAEVSYNLFHRKDQLKAELIPFLRYEQYNTHASVEGKTIMNPEYNRRDLTVGLGWKIVSGAMLKIDYQVFRNNVNSYSVHQLNAGVAVWF
jgi:hypothetical protein